MDAYRIGFKFFIDDPLKIDHSRIVPLFHGWIQRQALHGHLLVDVADYSHVPNGPGVMLISHEANVGLDESGGRLGLFYARKRPLGGTLAQRLDTVLGATLQACQLLEADTSAGTIRFRTNEVSLRLLDRLEAPNNDQTLAQVRPDLESLLTTLYGGPAKITRTADSRLPFELRVSTETSPTVDQMLQRLSSWRGPFV
jgi:hypothetical protein